MRKLISLSMLTALDVGILGVSLGVAFVLRYDGTIPPEMYGRLAASLPVVVALQYLSLSAAGLRRAPWSCVGFREVFRIFLAVAAATTVLFAAWAVSVALSARVEWAQALVIPLGAIGIDAAIAFVTLSGARGVARLLAEQWERGSHARKDLIPTMLIGAGMEGILVAKEIGNHPDLRIRPVGFLDDDRLKHGQVIHGVKVHGGTAELVALCRRHGAKQVLITSSALHRKDIRRIAQLCESSGIAAKIVPGVFEIVGWRATLSRIRKVEIEDLLGREPVKLDSASIEADLRGKVVLVTGAGGSIGSEICRQICTFQPRSLILVEQAENSLFQIHRELVADHGAVELVPRIADVCDASRMAAIFREHRPNAVFHAAAHKHVPMMECNPGEAIKNNVFGSRVVADLAHAHEVQEFVLISTDKAVNPTSVMGASKRMAEIYVQALSQRSETRFVVVRFGNVLGSAGSVIPIFQDQIAKGGPVTVTHPEMRRYFMTIPEACQLVLEAGSMGKGGEIFVLDMGEPVRILDLTRDLITLSGLRPDDDIEIVFTGIRPGEKLYEELSTEGEEVSKTRHRKIFIGNLQPHRWEQVTEDLKALRELADQDDPAALRKKLMELIPEFRHESFVEGELQSAG